jgi:hypothetical protein
MSRYTMGRIHGDRGRIAKGTQVSGRIYYVDFEITEKAKSCDVARSFTTHLA